MAEDIETSDLGGAVLRIAPALFESRSRAEVLERVTSPQTLVALRAESVTVYRVEGVPPVLRPERHRGIAGEPPTVALAAAEPLAAAAREGTVRGDRSAVYVPLGDGAEPLGALRIVFTSALAPEAAGLEPLAALGKLVAAALRAVTASSARLDLLRAAGARVAEALAILPESQLRAAVQREFRLWPGLHEEVVPDSLRAALEKILQGAVRATDAECGALGVGDSAARPFEPWVAVGIPDEQARAVGRAPRPVGTLGIVALEGKVLSTPDVHAHPRFCGYPPHHPDVRSMLGVPIRYQGMSLGNLYLGNKRGGQPFADEDQAIVEMLASQAGIALQQAYLRSVIDVQRSQLQFMLASTPQGFMFIDARSQHLLSNARMIALLGGGIEADAGRQQLVGRLYYPDGRSLTLDELPSSRALTGEVVSSEELALRQPGGRELAVVVSAAPVRSADGTILGAVVTAEDVSSIKALEQLREEFAAVVAHDLRDPIQAILLDVELLRRQRAGDVVTAPWSRIERIERSARRLGQITHDVLDSARIELHRVQLEREPVEIVAAVQALLERLGPALGRHPVTFEAAGSVTVSADPVRLDQICTNLLDNAAKFSAEGAPIHVRVAAVDDGVAVSVHDQGVGLTPEELRRLFERFYQSKRARARKTGLGLGLYITKGLVEAHGGRLAVESEPGRGSVFTVWLPREPPAT